MKPAAESPESTSDPSLSLPMGFCLALCEAANLDVDPSRIESMERAAQALTPTWTDWREALRGQLAAPGLVCRDVHASLEELLAALRPGAPLVTWTAQKGWIALLEGVRGRVCIASSEARNDWVSVETLRSMLDPDLLEGQNPWVAVEAPILPKSSGMSTASRTTPFWTLMRIVRPERSDMTAIVLYSGFTGLLSLAIPIAVQQLVNSVAFGGLVQPVVVLATLLFLGLAAAAFLYGSQVILAELFQQRLFVRACLDLARRLPRLHDDAFTSRSMTAYVNRFFDLVTVQKTGARLLLEGSGVVLQAATGLLVLSLYHPLMLALSIFLFSAMVLVTFSAGRAAPTTAIGESTAKYALAEWMEELVRHPTIFRTSAGRSRAESRADLLISSWVAARKSHFRIVFRQFVAALSLQVVVNAGLLALGGYLVVANELTLGQLVASEIVVASVVASFSRLAKHFEIFYDLLAASVKVRDLFELPLETPPQGRDAIGEPSAICLRGQDLSIPGPRGQRVEGWTLEIAEKECVMLSGGSAGLQSRAIDLLAGLQPVSSGFVTFRGLDLRDLSAQAIRDRMIVIREPQTIPGSILENLGMARANADLAEVQSALTRVGLLDSIRALPEGLDTVLDERGKPLDADENLRLEIARALIAQPDVLFLDMPGAALDQVGWDSTLDALFSEGAPWTVVVSSRLAEIEKRCHRTIRIESTSPRPDAGARPADGLIGGTADVA